MPEFYDPDVLAHLQSLEMGILRDVDAICREHGLKYFGFCGTGIGALRHKGYIPWDDDIDISMPRKDYEELLRIVSETMSDKYYVLNTTTDPNFPLATTRLCLKGTTFLEYEMQDVDCQWGIFLDLYALDNAADNPVAFYWQMWTSWFWGKLLILRSVRKPYLYIHGLPAKIVRFCCMVGHDLMRLFHISKKWLAHMRDRALRRYENRETKRITFFCDPLPYKNTFTNADIYPLRDLPFEDIRMPFPNNLEELLTKMYGDYMTMPPVERRKTHFPFKLDFGPYPMPEQSGTKDESENN